MGSVPVRTAPERGRLLDVVILAGDTILVLEFKDAASSLQAHIDQVAAYGRGLPHYHAASHDHRRHTVLVLTESQMAPSQEDGVWVSGASGLASLLSSPMATPTGASIDPVGWLAADYASLASLVSAARRIFQHEPLPAIRRAQSAGIPQTLASLVAIA